MHKMLKTTFSESAIERTQIFSALPSANVAERQLNTVSI